MPASKSSARGDVCGGSNSRTCPLEVEIVMTAQAEDEEERAERLWASARVAPGHELRVSVRACVRAVVVLRLRVRS